MSELAELLERFRRGPELVAAVLTGAAGAEVDFEPGPNTWSVRTIMAHLSDSEMEAAMRLRRVIAEDEPTLQRWDQEAFARKLDYPKRKPSQSLETFRRIRAENYELLKDLPSETYERTGNHTENGRMTLLDLLRIYAQHAESHAQQIRRTRDAYKATKKANA
jgi:hypothetical protein